MNEQNLDRAREARNDDEVETVTPQLQRDFLERASPIIFDAATNDYPAEGRFSQQISHLHSGRTAIIGAVGTYAVADPNGKPVRHDKIIAPYSVYGAQVCAILPSNLGRQLEGTSFSTPDAASMYRQMSEWYGDRLSYEEIMAAALLTADRDIFDYNDVAAVTAMMTGQAPFDPSKMSVSPVLFSSNGGGMPVSERCGAGMINPEKWNEALKKMVEMKKAAGNAAYHTGFVAAGDPAEINAMPDGKTKEYVYRMRLTGDMTLGKLTFYLPQMRSRHSEVVVVTPSGYGVHMPKSPSDTVTTVAFSYEDVKAGQFIEIRTTEPLGRGAGMMLRGHDTGNAIQMLRDDLKAQGLLPQPLKAMTGPSVTGDLVKDDMKHVPVIAPAKKNEKKTGESKAVKQGPVGPQIPDVPGIRPGL
jgi:hypothetical protein